MFFLVAYDIADKRRLKKVAKLMEAYGTRVQRSVFECDLSQTMLTVLVYQLKAIIKPRWDRVHVYRFCAACPSLEETIESFSSKKDGDIFIY